MNRATLFLFVIATFLGACNSKKASDNDLQDTEQTTMMSANDTGELKDSLFDATIRSDSVSELDSSTRGDTPSSADDNEKAAVESSLPNARVVLVKYRKPINGFNVSVVWKPEYISYEHLCGGAILEFKDAKTQFSIVNNAFFMPDSLFDVATKDDGYTVEGVYPGEITVDYTAPVFKEKPLCLSDAKVPFFFLDVDFDGAVELILTKYMKSQRSSHKYDVYSIGGKDRELEVDFHQITHLPPYADFDGYTYIDYRKKEIRQYWSSGANYINFDVYRKVEGELYPVKVQRVSRERTDEEKWIEVVYDVKRVNGTEIESQSSMKIIESDELW